MKSKVSIQKGFVFGVTAVAVVAVLTGVVMRMSTISADTNSTASAATNCVSGSTMAASPLTDYEQTNFGAKANAYQVTTLQKKTFRFVVGVTQQSSIGAGGVVNTKVGIGNLNNAVYTEKDGRMVVVLPDGTKVDYYYGNPNLAVGAYWSATKAVSLTSYSSIIRLENRNGSGYYLQGCVANAIDLSLALASPVPSATASSTASITPTGSQIVTDGSFENGTDGWVGQNATVTQVASLAHTGTHSLKVNTTANNGGARHTFPTVAGTRYQISAWLNNTNANTRIWVSGAGLWTGDLLRMTPQVSSDWAQVSDTFTATGTTTNIDYRPASTTMGMGNMDDFTLTAVNATPSVTPSVSASASPSVTPSVSSSAAPAVSLVPVASIESTLKQGTKILFYGDTQLKDGVLARKDTSVNYNWGNQAPNTGLVANNWSSVVTSRVLAPTTGDYSIGVTYNDGVRVWLGGRKIMDDWTTWAPCPNDTTGKCDNTLQVKKLSAKVHMEQGQLYNLRIEYYDVSAKGVLKLFWKMPNANAGEIIPAKYFFTDYNPNPAHGTGTGLLGMYYNGIDFSTYEFFRKDPTVNFNWNLAAPQNTMTPDNFSAKWTGKVRPRFSEAYTFKVTAKDGVRLWVNNTLVIDQWHDVSQATLFSGQINLGAGKLYPISLEYYNSQGAASVNLKWQSPSEKLALIPATDLYYPGAPITSVVPSPSPSPSASASASVSPSAVPLTITLKPGWNAISIPNTSLPVLAGPLRDPSGTYAPANLQTYSFDATTTDSETGKLVRAWNPLPSVFNKRVGYYVKNNSGQDLPVTFQNSTTPNHAVMYKGWNLLANSNLSAKALSDMTFTKKTCTDGGADPIKCTGSYSAVALKALTYGKVGEGKAGFTSVYYIAKPNADSNTPNPFTIFDVAAKGGPANVKIPAGGAFWLYLFD